MNDGLELRELVMLLILPSRKPRKPRHRVSEFVISAEQIWDDSQSNPLWMKLAERLSL